MTRRLWGPAPPPAALAETPLDVLAREWPESLAVLRRHGVDPRAGAPASLRAVAGDRLPRILEELEVVLARRTAPPA